MDTYLEYVEAVENAKAPRKGVYGQFLHGIRSDVKGQNYEECIGLLELSARSFLGVSIDASRRNAT